METEEFDYLERLVKIWDSRSTTQDLMLLYHLMTEDFKHRNDENLSYKEFDDLRAYTLTEIQKGNAQINLYRGMGLHLWNLTREDLDLAEVEETPTE